jgi:hypothetical protein
LSDDSEAERRAAQRYAEAKAKSTKRSRENTETTVVNGKNKDKASAQARPKATEATEDEVVEVNMVDEVSSADEEPPAAPPTRTVKSNGVKPRQRELPPRKKREMTDEQWTALVEEVGG